MENLPLPRGTRKAAHLQQDGLPDYYLGRLIVFEEMSEDNCRWVVYDGHNRVRCPSRASAVDYISSIVKETDDRTRLLISRASYFAAKARETLEAAANSCSDPTAALLLRQRAVEATRLRLNCDICEEQFEEAQAPAWARQAAAEASELGEETAALIERTERAEQERNKIKF